MELNLNFDPTYTTCEIPRYDNISNFLELFRPIFPLPNFVGVFLLIFPLPNFVGVFLLIFPLPETAAALESYCLPHSRCQRTNLKSGGYNFFTTNKQVIHEIRKQSFYQNNLSTKEL